MEKIKMLLEGTEKTKPAVQKKTNTDDSSTSSPRILQNGLEKLLIVVNWYIFQSIVL